VAQAKTGGKVYLIGAGPGDPELLTLKAARLLATADVLLMDDLVDRRVLAHARPGARVIRVGKRGGCRSTPQAFIERLMVRLARAGAVVARIKGGDPFVFGRGAEELARLLDRGVEVEVVSGVTAGIAAPATLGVPVTHREVARGVTFLTGHTHDGFEPHWGALAAAGTTLVVYMGMARLPALVAGMIAGGFSPATPACAIENATLPAQRQVFAPLAALPQAVAAAGLGSPAVLVIGEVVRFARTAGRVPAARTAGGAS
jgi:uroporphyrin-III C-methyltransferase